MLERYLSPSRTRISTWSFTATSTWRTGARYGSVDRARNHSIGGFPVDPTVTLQGEGSRSPVASAAPTEEASDWVIRWTVPTSHAAPAVISQKLSYVWRGGALLEDADLQAYTGHPLGFLRGEGFEYSSIRSRHSTVSRATLVVRLPPWAAPEAVEVRAYDAHDRVRAERRRGRRGGRGVVARRPLLLFGDDDEEIRGRLLF
jgi:hypothetical protein